MTFWMAYCYDELCSNNFKIRLLSIEAASNPRDIINVKLRVVDLDLKHKKYVALSYTWGRPSPRLPDTWDNNQATKTIIVNGVAFEVRYNLFAALKTIRQKWDLRYDWWIDAICIDQNNFIERSSQVSRMREIYAHSDHTLIWLGPSMERTQMAFQEIVSLSKSWHERCESLQRIPVKGKEDIESYAQILKREVIEKYQSPAWRALQHLLSRSWFERVWVRQEFCASGQVLVQCGDDCIPWTHLMDIRTLFMQHIACANQATGDDPISASEIVKSMYGATQTLYNLGEMSIEYRSRDTGTELPSLVYILSQLRSTRATDPRDKVYAALGLAREDERIPVDYRLSPEAVYTQTAQKSMQSTKTFNMLAYCNYPPSMDTLPTWVADWTDGSCSRREVLPATGVRRYIRKHQPLYQVLETSDFYVRFDDDNRTMIVKAFILDHLSFISTESSYRIPTQQTDLGPTTLAARAQYVEQLSKQDRDTAEVILNFKWLREWVDFETNLNHGGAPQVDRERNTQSRDAGVERFDGPTYRDTGQTLGEAYVRTLCADASFDSKKGHAVRIPDTVEGISFMMSDDARMPLEISSRLEGRSWAMSTKYMALVPAEARIGDKIVLIQGSQAPFILRPSGAEFQFIGLAYVHGVADGELWKEGDRILVLEEI
ncbi:hypothetical protein MMC21_008462, partial [Puttea exsequens]|nr:hypothetical protein [Puttea exsequens]